MQLIIDLTPEQEAALTYAAKKVSTADVPVTPEDYLRARIDEVLASYVALTTSDDTQALVEAFESASDADKEAVFAALKAERPTRTDAEATK